MGTCRAYCSAGTASPYSPSDPLRSAIAVAADDETVVAVAASSATTPRLLTYRGIKNIRIAQRWPPPPPYSWRVTELPRVEPRACVHSMRSGKIRGKGNQLGGSLEENSSLPYSAVFSFTLSDASKKGFFRGARDATLGIAWSTGRNARANGRSSRDGMGWNSDRVSRYQITSSDKQFGAEKATPSRPLVLHFQVICGRSKDYNYRVTQLSW